MYDVGDRRQATVVAALSRVHSISSFKEAESLRLQYT